MTDEVRALLDLRQPITSFLPMGEHPGLAKAEVPTYNSKRTICGYRTLGAEFKLIVRGDNTVAIEVSGRTTSLERTGTNEWGSNGAKVVVYKNALPSVHFRFQGHDLGGTVADEVGLLRWIREHMTSTR